MIVDTDTYIGNLFFSSHSHLQLIHWLEFLQYLFLLSNQNTPVWNDLELTSQEPSAEQ
jgi:hypothetical protein